jgi:hypothetical protein
MNDCYWCLRDIHTNDDGRVGIIDPSGKAVRHVIPPLEGVRGPRDYLFDIFRASHSHRE